MSEPKSIPLNNGFFVRNEFVSWEKTEEFMDMPDYIKVSDDYILNPVLFSCMDIYEICSFLNNKLDKDTLDHLYSELNKIQF